MVSTRQHGPSYAISNVQCSYAKISDDLSYCTLILYVTCFLCPLPLFLSPSPFFHLISIPTPEATSLPLPLWSVRIFHLRWPHSFMNWYTVITVVLQFCQRIRCLPPNSFFYRCHEQCSCSQIIACKLVLVISICTCSSWVVCSVKCRIYLHIDNIFWNVYLPVYTTLLFAWLWAL